jgi:hypothetical protein
VGLLVGTPYPAPMVGWHTRRVAPPICHLEKAHQGDGVTDFHHGFVIWNDGENHHQQFYKNQQ